MKEQRREHAEHEEYGSRGFNWAYLVAGIALIEGCDGVLDYGCGKASLSASLRLGGMAVQDYDPGIAAFAARPSPADLVVCTDVLEHIQPETLDAVLSDLKGLARRFLFLAVSTRPSGRTLSSGRNAHLMVRPPEWWRKALAAKLFHVKREWNTGQPEWVALLCS